MKNNLNKNHIERYSRQIVLKDVGINCQKKIISSKVLIVGAGGLGCPIIDYLSRSGVGTIGVADYDKVTLSNIFNTQNKHFIILMHTHRHIISYSLHRVYVLLHYRGTSCNRS